MNKSTVKNLIAGGIASTAVLYLVYQGVAGGEEIIVPPVQPDLALDLNDESFKGLPPMLGDEGRHLFGAPRLHDHNGREVPPFGSGNPLSSLPEASPYEFLLVPEELRPIFAGAAIGNWNALKFSADGSKIGAVGVFVSVSDLDCTAAKTALKEHLDHSPYFILNPELREEVEANAKQLFDTGELEYLSLGLKREELPPEFADMDEDTKAKLLEIQKQFWAKEWPDSVDLKVTLQCRAETFGHDM